MNTLLCKGDLSPTSIIEKRKDEDPSLCYMKGTHTYILQASRESLYGTGASDVYRYIWGTADRPAGSHCTEQGLVMYTDIYIWGTADRPAGSHCTEQGLVMYTDIY
eukprot:Tbor_TRINITY_DN6122_c5_g2::TRINITY_DN6122_c5_g2_i14::g.22808::m.22808